MATDHSPGRAGAVRCPDSGAGISPEQCWTHDSRPEAEIRSEAPEGARLLHPAASPIRWGPEWRRYQQRPSKCVPRTTSQKATGHVPDQNEGQNPRMKQQWSQGRRQVPGDTGGAAGGATQPSRKGSPSARRCGGINDVQRTKQM